MPTKQLFFGSLLTLGLAVIGFGLGGLLAARFLVSPDNGLAGATTTALCALGGAMAGMVAGVLLTRGLAAVVLARAALGAMGILLLGIGFLLFR